MYICCTCNVLIYNVVSVNIKIINKVFQLKIELYSWVIQDRRFETYRCIIDISPFFFFKNNKIISRYLELTSEIIEYTSFLTFADQLLLDL